MPAVELHPNHSIDLARRGLTLELLEHAEDVRAEAENLLRDPDAVKVADVRNHVASLARVAALLEAFDWPE